MKQLYPNYLIYFLKVNKNYQMVKILDTGILLNWIGTGILAVLTGYLFRTGLKKRYYNPYLIVSITCSLIGIILESIMYHIQKTGNVPLVNFFYALHITLFCFYFFYMFLFLNSLVKARPSIPSLVFISGLIAIMFMGAWVHYFFFPQDSYNDGSVIVTVSRLAFDFTGVYVFGIQGITIYYRIYRKVEEKLALLFIFTQFSMFSGYFFRVFRELINLTQFYSPETMVPQINPSLIHIFDVIGMVGGVLYIVLYSYNIKYIVRLPDDIYFFGIYTISGLQIYKANLKVSKPLRVEDRLLSGIFSAFYNIFKGLFKSHHPIEIIKSKDFSLVFIAQEHIMLVTATENPTYTLEHAMWQFFKQFNQEFPGVYQKDHINLGGIEKLDEILQERFPFLEIERDSGKISEKISSEMSLV